MFSKVRRILAHEKIFYTECREYQRRHRYDYLDSWALLVELSCSSLYYKVSWSTWQTTCGLLNFQPCCLLGQYNASRSWQRGLAGEEDIDLPGGLPALRDAPHHQALASPAVASRKHSRHACCILVLSCSHLQRICFNWSRIQRIWGAGVRKGKWGFGLQRTVPRSCSTPSCSNTSFWGPWKPMASKTSWGRVCWKFDCWKN